MRSKAVSPTSGAPAQRGQIFKTVAKWALAVILVYALIKSGKLSPDSIARFFQSPKLAALCLLLVIVQALGTFFRWRMLLKSLGFPIRFFEAVRLGMTGMFFSTVIPGTVGGDFIKALYIARKYPAARSRAISTIILDRVSGLIAVLLWGGLAFLVGYSKLSSIGSVEANRVKMLGMLLAFGAAMLLLGLAIYPVVARRLPAEMPAFLRKVPGHLILSEFYRVAMDFHSNPFVLWRVVGASLFLQSLNFGVMGIIAFAIYGPPPWGQLEPTTFLLSAVLGVCAMAIPLTPMGLGVGQVAFSAVFLAVGAANAEFGSGIITNYQILQLMMGLIGMIFFVSYKHKVEESSSA